MCSLWDEYMFTVNTSIKIIDFCSCSVLGDALNELRENGNFISWQLAPRGSETKGQRHVWNYSPKSHSTVVRHRNVWLSTLKSWSKKHEYELFHAFWMITFIYLSLNDIELCFDASYSNRAATVISRQLPMVSYASATLRMESQSGENWHQVLSALLKWQLQKTLIWKLVLKYK